MTLTYVPNRPAQSIILDRMIGFMDHLRMNHFAVGPREVELAMKVVQNPLSTFSEAQLKLKILLSGRQEEWSRFDDLFEAYWVVAGKERTAVEKSQKKNKKQSIPQAWDRHFDQHNMGQDRHAMAPQIEAEGDDGSDGEASGRLIASDKTSIMKTDLRQIAEPNEIRQAEALAYRLASGMRYRLSRRYRKAHKGKIVDIRKTIRKNLGHGGEMVELAYRKKKDQPIRLVVFLDVSGSMQHYSRFFLQFVKGLIGQWADADAYLFHTRLVRMTETLRDKNSMQAMARLSLLARGFGGGTKFGESLAHFNTLYAKRSLNSRTVVMVLSDGYDTGEVSLMAQQIAQVKKRASKLIWLNPLLGWAQYEPITAAISEIRPYLDYFAPANTLESLLAIENELIKV